MAESKKCEECPEVPGSGSRIHKENIGIYSGRAGLTLDYIYGIHNSTSGIEPIRYIEI